MSNYMKTCSFLHAHFTETIKVVENLVKKVYGEKHIEKTYVVDNLYQQHKSPKKKKKYFGVYTYRVSCPLSLTHFKHLKLPITMKIPVILPQIVYIYMTAVFPNLVLQTTFFANLVVAWL